MGCDIHTYVEVFKTVNDQEKWICADRFSLNAYYPKYKEDGEEEYEVDHIFGERNYALFDALVGVRKGGQEVKQMSDPRGLPDDCGAVAKKGSDRYGCDGHSHSWVTLQELYDYQDECKNFKYSGLVSPEQAKDLDENGRTPDLWRQGTGNPDYVRRVWTVDYCVMDSLIEAVEPRARKDHSLYCKDDERVGRKSAEKTRLVFFFDN